MNKQGVITGITTSAFIAVLPMLAPSTVLAATSFNSQYQSNLSQETSLLQTANSSSATSSANSSEIAALKTTVTNLNTQISNLYTVEQNLANAKSSLPQVTPSNLHTQIEDLTHKRQQLLEDSKNEWAIVNKYHWSHDNRGKAFFAHAKQLWKAIGSKLSDVDDQLTHVKQRVSDFNFAKPYNDSLNSLQHTILKLQATSLQYTKAWIALEQVGSSSSSTSTSSLPAPSGISVSNITNTGFSVSWNSVSGAVGYDVYVNGTQVGTTSNTNTTGTSFTVTGEQPNTTYQVTVTAVDSQGNQSSVSNATSVTTSSFDITANNATTSGFTLNWPTVAGASTYDVHVLDSNNNPVLTLNGVTGNAVTLSSLGANTNYYVYVTAMSNTGAQIAKSDVPNVATLN